MFDPRGFWDKHLSHLNGITDPMEIWNAFEKERMDRGLAPEMAELNLETVGYWFAYYSNPDNQNLIVGIKLQEK